MKTAVVRCAVLALFLAALPVVAQTGVWTAAGSTGSIDEASLGSYATGITNLLHAPGALGNVVSRFNVTNTYGGGLTDTPPWNTLEMTYFDIDATSLVTTTLYRVNRCSNLVTVVCSVSSVDSTTAMTCGSCTFGTPLNFALNHYVVETRLSRAVTTSAPQLFGLRIF
jgi:hypothetical protein